MKTYTIITVSEKDNIFVFDMPGEGKVISLSPGNIDYDNRPTMVLNFESIGALEKMESALARVMAGMVKKAANE